MRFTLPLLLSLTLFGCSFGGFQPPPPHDHWRLHNSRVLFPNSDPQGRIKFLDRRQKDMSDCGMDFVIGESVNPEVNLCLEKKGSLEADFLKLCDAVTVNPLVTR